MKKSMMTTTRLNVSTLIRTKERSLREEAPWFVVGYWTARVRIGIVLERRRAAAIVDRLLSTTSARLTNI